MAEQTPEQEVIEMLALAAEETLPWLKPNTADTIGIYTIWLEFVRLNRSLDYDAKPIVRIDVEEKRMEINIQSEHSDLSELVEKWLAEIEKIAHVPSGWRLVIFLMGESITMRSVEFPEWNDGFGAD